MPRTLVIRTVRLRPSVSLTPPFTRQSGRVVTTLFLECGKKRNSIWGLPEWFAVAQVAGPAMLYLPGTQLLRVTAADREYSHLHWSGLAGGLATLTANEGSSRVDLLVIAAVYMTFMIFHPATNTVMAGMAQIGMHVAVAAPLFWAPDYFGGDYRRLLRVLTILWVLNGASVVGRHPPGSRSGNLDAGGVQQLLQLTGQMQNRGVYISSGRWQHGDSSSWPGRHPRGRVRRRDVRRYGRTRLPWDFQCLD